MTKKYSPGQVELTRISHQFEVVVEQIDHEYLVRNLDYPAIVTHPTSNSGRIVKWEVSIDCIAIRRSKKEGQNEFKEEYVFRGEAHVDEWTGPKTFFAKACTEVIDRRTGQTMKNEKEIMEWLIQIVDRYKIGEYQRTQMKIFDGADGVLARYLNKLIIVDYKSRDNNIVTYVVLLEQITRHRGQLLCDARVWKLTSEEKRVKKVSYSRKTLLQERIIRIRDPFDGKS